jgi:D-glycero-alpha-D-manno-heptose-7-phosphate kinase
MIRAIPQARVRCRAPLRLDPAGGGTDLSPYCDEFGGAVLNMCISRFALTTLEARTDGMVRFVSHDLGLEETLPAAVSVPLEGMLPLQRALYNRIQRDHPGEGPLSLTLTTSVDCPKGAGLGASSALMVSMIGAYRLWLGLPLADFDVAHLADEVERIDLGLAAGRQDQYAATFGGLNFMEFAARDRVIVNPLHLEQRVIRELEASILLVLTGTSRDSATIIERQIGGLQVHDERPLNAMHQLKRDALELKAALLRAELHSIPEIINRSWAAKKATSDGISTALIDRLYETAIGVGALAGKVSGAGGGGFMMLVDPLDRDRITRVVQEMGAQVSSCNHAAEGVFAWLAPEDRR